MFPYWSLLLLLKNQTPTKYVPLPKPIIVPKKTKTHTNHIPLLEPLTKHVPLPAPFLQSSTRYSSWGCWCRLWMFSGWCNSRLHKTCQSALCDDSNRNRQDQTSCHRFTLPKHLQLLQGTKYRLHVCENCKFPRKLFLNVAMKSTHPNQWRLCSHGKG